METPRCRHPDKFVNAILDVPKGSSLILEKSGFCNPPNKREFQILRYSSFDITPWKILNSSLIVGCETKSLNFHKHTLNSYASHAHTSNLPSQIQLDTRPRTYRDAVPGIDGRYSHNNDRNFIFGEDRFSQFEGLISQSFVANQCNFLSHSQSRLLLLSK